MDEVIVEGTEPEVIDTPVVDETVVPTEETVDNPVEVPTEEVQAEVKADIEEVTA